MRIATTQQNRPLRQAIARLLRAAGPLMLLMPLLAPARPDSPGHVQQRGSEPARGKVVGTGGSTSRAWFPIMVSLGTQDGLKPGDRLTVWRDGSYICILPARQVYTHWRECQVVDMGRGARPEDDVTVGERVAVLPFEDMTHDSGKLGRIAEETVARELAISPRLVLVTAADVQAAVKKVNPAFPLSRSDESALVKDLRATLLVEGAVTPTESARETERVSFQVQVIRAESGTVVGSAVQIDEVWSEANSRVVTDAATGCCVLAIRRMLNTNVREGTLLTTIGGGRPGFLVVNRGTVDGYRKGMRLAVIRGNERVAAVRVSSVYPEVSELGVVRVGKGIRPEDRLRAEYKTPYYLLRRGESVHPLPEEFWPADPARPSAGSGTASAPRPGH